MGGLFKMIVAAPSCPQAAPPAVFVTNQVAGDPINGGHRVTLGHVWHHAVNWRLVVRHGPSMNLRAFNNTNGAPPQQCRSLHVEKSPCSAPITIPFVITQD